MPNIDFQNSIYITSQKYGFIENPVIILNCQIWSLSDSSGVINPSHLVLSKVFFISLSVPFFALNGIIKC